MAQFSMGVRVVARSKGQSIMAAAAYRAGEKLWDDRQGISHDFRHKLSGVEHKEMLFPDNAPDWVQGIKHLSIDLFPARLIAIEFCARCWEQKQSIQIGVVGQLSDDLLFELRPITARNDRDHGNPG